MRVRLTPEVVGAHCDRWSRRHGSWWWVKPRDRILAVAFPSSFSHPILRPEGKQEGIFCTPGKEASSRSGQGTNCHWLMLLSIISLLTSHTLGLILQHSFACPIIQLSSFLLWVLSIFVQWLQPPLFTCRLFAQNSRQQMTSKEHFTWKDKRVWFEAVIWVRQVKRAFIFLQFLFLQLMSTLPLSELQTSSFPNGTLHDRGTVSPAGGALAPGSAK